MLPFILLVSGGTRAQTPSPSRAPSPTTTADYFYGTEPPTATDYGIDDFPFFDDDDLFYGTSFSYDFLEETYYYTTEPPTPTDSGIDYGTSFSYDFVEEDGSPDDEDEEPLFSGGNFGDSFRRPRSRWWTAVYVFTLAASTCCLCILRAAILTDAGEFGAKAAGLFVGPRRKRLLLALSSMSWISTFAFTLELWLSKRWTFASAATSCIFGGIVGTWLFFRSHVYSKYALDADIFNRFHYTHSAASFLVFFDTELTPVLPWDHRRGLEIVSDGFPDALSAKASIVFVLMREIMQLTFCALNVFVRNQWEVTSLGNFLMGILEIARLLVTRCRFSAHGCCADRRLFHQSREEGGKRSGGYVEEESFYATSEGSEDGEDPIYPSVVVEEEVLCGEVVEDEETEPPAVREAPRPPVDALHEPSPPLPHVGAPERATPTTPPPRPDEAEEAAPPPLPDEGEERPPSDATPPPLLSAAAPRPDEAEEAAPPPLPDEGEERPPSDATPPLPSAAAPKEDKYAVHVFTFTHRVSRDVVQSIPDSITLAGGTLVQRTGAEGPWTRVTTADGREGLVPTGSLDELTLDIGQRVADDQYAHTLRSGRTFSSRLRDMRTAILPAGASFNRKKRAAETKRVS